MTERNDSKVVGKGGECECGSSDARFKYDDGHYYCFSCSTFTPPPLKETMEEEQPKDSSQSVYTHEYVALRGIGKATMRKYKTVCSIDDEGVPVHMRFPYGNLTIVKKLSDKSFHTEGDPKEVKLFGEELFNSGEAQSITICEGAEDAMSVYEMLGSKYPAVSVRSAVHARRDCERRFEFINSFSKIYLCFDNDAPGQKALKDVASLFDVNKVYHVKLDKYKDANDYHVNNAQDAFVRVWWNSKRYLPKGIIGSYEDVASLLSEKEQDTIGSYPFPTLQQMTFGIRPGEVNLFTAQEKVGKTEFMRAIEHHLLSTTDHNMGIIHLEEGEKRSVQGLIGYHLGAPVHLPSSDVSLEEQTRAYADLSKRDGRVYYYTHFGSDDPDVILNAIRYLAGVCNCKFIFLDHISMIVSGLHDDDERKTLDYISTKLAMMTRELQFTLFMVSHVNDNDQTRGSRNISKVADLIVHLSRQKEHPDEEVRSIIELMVKGNRFGGFSGPGGLLKFNKETYRLHEQDTTVQTPF
jgi:twinkle protein